VFLTVGTLTSSVTSVKDLDCICQTLLKMLGQLQVSIQLGHNLYIDVATNVLKLVQTFAPLSCSFMLKERDQKPDFIRLKSMSIFALA